MNFGELRDRIADEINRDDLDSQIEDAIVDAIREYGTKKLRWNSDVQSTTMTTGNGALSLPPGFFGLISLKIRDSAGVTDSILEYRTYQELDEIDSTVGNEGTPVYYSIFQDVFRVYPIPDYDYITFVSYWRTYDEPVVAADEHVLITNAPNLIKYRAKEVLFGNYLFDNQQAIYYGALADREYMRIKRSHDTEAGDLVLAIN
jgi:hypothetical protein